VRPLTPTHLHIYHHDFTTSLIVLFRRENDEVAHPHQRIEMRLACSHSVWGDAVGAANYRCKVQGGQDTGEEGEELIDVQPLKNAATIGQRTPQSGSPDGSKCAIVSAIRSSSALPPLGPFQSIVARLPCGALTSVALGAHAFRTPRGDE